MSVPTEPDPVPVPLPVPPESFVAFFVVVEECVFEFELPEEFDPDPPGTGTTVVSSDPSPSPPDGLSESV